MADLKATSFRISEEDLEKFKQFMDQEGIKTQADGFKSIMQSVEMAKAKNILSDRGKEIETFQETINNLMSMFLNSLNVNQTSEERIRDQLSLELNTKDNTISTMYEQLQEVKAENKALKDNNKELNDNIKVANEEVKRLNSDILDRNKNIDKLSSNNDLLQENLQEYKKYKDNYKNLESELEQLKADNSTKDNTINSLENINKQLEGKIKNDSDMIEFYKSNNIELKSNIEQYKGDNKALEQQHKQEIENIKADHTKAVQEQLKALQEQLQNKHDIEVAKKDLEFHKLNNEIEQLKAKKVKPVTNKINN